MSYSLEKNSNRDTLLYSQQIIPSTDTLPEETVYTYEKTSKELEHVVVRLTSHQFTEPYILDLSCAQYGYYRMTNSIIPEAMYRKDRVGRTYYNGRQLGTTRDEFEGQTSECNRLGVPLSQKDHLILEAIQSITISVKQYMQQILPITPTELLNSEDIFNRERSTVLADVRKTLTEWKRLEMLKVQQLDQAS